MSCFAPPTESVALLGITVTVATGGSVTVTCAAPVLSSITATMLTGAPAATQVTRRVDYAVAFATFEDVHTTVAAESRSSRA